VGRAERQRRGATPYSEFDAGLGQRLPLRILLAEDNHDQPGARRCGSCSAWATAATSWATGREAVEAVERRPYDVVLMDVEMPEMDGLEAARQIGHALGAHRPTHHRDDGQRHARRSRALPRRRHRRLRRQAGSHRRAPGRPAAAARGLSRAHDAAAQRSAGHGRGDPTPAALDALPILDVTAFDEAREFLGEEADEVIGRVVGSFRANTPTMLASVRDACAKGDAAQLHMSASHDCKGLSGTVGARPRSGAVPAARVRRPRRAGGRSRPRRSIDSRASSPWPTRRSRPKKAPPGDRRGTEGSQLRAR
jgi:CheY-like chemotaxis protein